MTAGRGRVRNGINSDPRPSCRLGGMLIGKLLPSRHLLAAALLLACPPSPALAQRFKYDNRQQLLGAAHVSPESGRRVLGNIFRYCTENNASLQHDAAREMEAWEARHKLYLDASEMYRRKLKKLISDPSLSPEHRAKLNEMQEQVEKDALTDAVAAQTEAFIVLLRSAQKHGGSEDLCREYIRSVADGKWDLARNDPALAKFFDEERQSAR